MSQLDAFKLSNSIRSRLVDFAMDFNFARDRKITEICRRIWSGKAESGGLVSDLWVEGAFPSKSAEESLADLVSQGQFDGGLQDHLHARDAVPRDRKLYLHQRDAILEAQKEYENNSKPALVITAGTGAGKTESFLLPVLNDLYKNRIQNKNGIQCLILYPMNALVNDQVDRIHEWLKEQEELTLFHFTSETPEDSKRADQCQYPKWENEPFRIRTRQEARGFETHQGKGINLSKEDRGSVPNILITNYSMLEYMLCRPQDSVFFGNSLRAIVLDEAHLYTGTLAAEITLLLRRLLQRCGLNSTDVLQLATSATIGTGERGELENFAAELFSKPVSLVRVIRGEVQKTVLPDPDAPSCSITTNEMAQRIWLNEPTLSADGKSLIRNPDLCRTLAKDLSLLIGEDSLIEARQKANDHPAKLLYEALSRAPILHQAVKIIEEKKRLPLALFAQELWGENSERAQRSSIHLLQMLASARPEAGTYPLLPHRLHLLARPTDGLVVCLNEECSGEPELKLEGLGCVIAGYSDHCPYCQSATVSLYRCSNCGEASLAGLTKGDKFLPIPSSEFEIKPKILSMNEVLGAGSIKLEVGDGKWKVFFGIDSCPNCDPKNDSNNKVWRQFVTPAQLMLSILAETSLAELPPFPVKNNPWLPACGRRLLAFSDSRQEAARLGPRLRLQHEIQLIRAALTRCAAQTPAADDTFIDYLVKSISQIKEQLSAPNLSPAMQQGLKTDLNAKELQLTESRQGGSVESWVKMLKNEEGIHELLDAESAVNHKPEYWRENTQREWEKNFKQIESQLKLMIGRELARTPSRREVSLETLGLIEVTYPGLDRLAMPSDFAGTLPEHVHLKLNFAWSDVLSMLLDTVRTDGAISLTGTDEDDPLQFGIVPIGKWLAEDKSNGWWLISFIGVRKLQKRRRFAQAILEMSGLPKDRAIEVAPELLRAAYKSLKSGAGIQLQWLKTNSRQTKDAPAEALQIYFPSLGLRRPLKLFRCKKTGHIWPRSVFGCSPESLEGTLIPVTEDELDRDSRVGRQRREFMESNIFKQALWAEEHSAQLSPQENRRIQDLFKIGARNILSSTTTLELGIDIGGLNGVLMSNVPPSKANYLQRAGRAGRRADGSSVVITYVRPRPFDREVFNRFGDFLDKSFRSPRIFLDRTRVVSRHGNAYLLGEFFRQIYPPETEVGAMSAFGNMGRFCGVPFLPFWGDRGPKPALSVDPLDFQIPTSLPWLREAQNKPGLIHHFIDFLEYLHKVDEHQYKNFLRGLFGGTPLEGRISEWPHFVDRLIESFKTSIKDWLEEYKNLREAWEAIDGVRRNNNDASPRSLANMLYYQSRALYETTVIEALADRQFLPRYGFPIGLQKLRVIEPSKESPKKIREEDQFRLERSGLLALREYVPGSQLLVGGKLVTSHGLLKHWTGADLNNYIGLRGHYAECKSGHIYYEISKPIGSCPICDSPADGKERPLLLPKHGFTSAAWDPPRLSADVEKVGNIERATITFAKSEGLSDLSDDEFAGIQGLTARYREAGEILVYNEGEHGKGFVICLQCGYADSEDKLAPAATPKGFDDHPRLISTNKNLSCLKNNPTPPLRNQVLAAREITDVLLIGFTGALQAFPKDEAVMQTLGYALQIAGAKILELDSREIGVMVAPASDIGEGFGAVLYDNVPGGAGHVRELFAKKREWLESAKSALFVNEEHHARCETACLDCLLTFDAQDAMRQGLLKRRLAWQVLGALLTGSSAEFGSAPNPDKESSDDITNSIEPSENGLISKEERIARAEMRKNKRR
jgi:ATP-dependent helicase YprA (DUF1998 family)